MVNVLYNVFLNPSEVGSDPLPPSFATMFPAATHLICEGCILKNIQGCQVETYHSLTIADSSISRISATDSFCATHITVTDLDFTLVRGAQFDLFLSNSTMSLYLRNDDSPDLCILSIPHAQLFTISGDYESHVNIEQPILYD